MIPETGLVPTREHLGGVRERCAWYLPGWFIYLLFLFKVVYKET